MSRGRRRPPGAVQGNAADPASIRRADRAVKEQSRTEAQDMAAVLSDPAGRRVLWRILKECKLLEEIWDPSVVIHYLAGRQSVGHFLLAQILATDPEAWLLMQRESQQRALRDEATAEAQHTESATVEGDEQR